jgi:hypothetical protein
MRGGRSAIRERPRPWSVAAFLPSVFSLELALQRQGSSGERAGGGDSAGVFAEQGSEVRDGLVSIVRTDTGKNYKQLHKCHLEEPTLARFENTLDCERHNHIIQFN